MKKSSKKPKKKQLVFYFGEYDDNNAQSMTIEELIDNKVEASGGGCIGHRKDQFWREDCSEMVLEPTQIHILKKVSKYKLIGGSA